jgi:putative drug exporter of the RND superfamily
VGADYNMLLISRIRDESPHGVRVGVIRTVGSTGGVITSAGLIFAASMFGLMTASIYTMAEAGFILGMGILIDTFLVRTITVPAMAALIGQKNWWPSHLGKSAAQVVAAHQKKQQQLDQLTEQLIRMKVIPSRETWAASAPSAVRDADAQPERPWASDDLLVRLKLVPPGHKSRSKKRAGPAAKRKGRPAEGAPANGKRSTERVPSHALPLFDLSGLPHHVADNLQQSGLDSARARSTKPKRERYAVHPLPLFGQDLESRRPLGVGKNGNGKPNGNGHADGETNGEEPADADVSQPLPLFGPSA